MKIGHETDGTVCADAIAELRCIGDGDVLAPTHDSFADARDRWGTAFDERPTAAKSDANVVAFSRFAQRSESSRAGRARVLIVPSPRRAKRADRPDLKTEIEQMLTEGRPELAVERFISAILTAGLAATLSDGATDARPREMPARNASSMLTRREREVAQLIAAGRTNRSIASELFIAQSTVERHVANILNKLGFNSRTQIATWTVTNGLATA